MRQKLVQSARKRRRRTEAIDAVVRRFWSRAKALPPATWPRGRRRRPGSAGPVAASRRRAETRRAARSLPDATLTTTPPTPGRTVLTRSFDNRRGSDHVRAQELPDHRRVRARRASPPEQGRLLVRRSDAGDHAPPERSALRRSASTSTRRTTTTTTERGGPCPLAAGSGRRSSAGRDATHSDEDRAMIVARPCGT